MNIEWITKRREGLKQEYAQGQVLLAELRGKASEIEQTLGRISGAIQVLDEALEEEAKREAIAKLEADDHRRRQQRVLVVSKQASIPPLVVDKWADEKLSAALGSGRRTPTSPRRSVGCAASSATISTRCGRWRTPAGIPASRSAVSWCRFDA